MADTLVNELTGETSSPAELLADLKRREREVTRMDDVITTLSGELKAAKKDREKAVAQLRSAIREVKSRTRLRKAAKK